MDDEDLNRGKWNPTREQFGAYEKREVELCVANLKTFGDGSLHSTETVTKAKALLGDTPLGTPVRLIPQPRFINSTGYSRR